MEAATIPDVNMTSKQSKSQQIESISIVDCEIATNQK
jgi:hypothetical protein